MTNIIIFNLISEVLYFYILVNSLVTIYFIVLTYYFLIQVWPKVDLRPDALPNKIWLRPGELWRYTRFISLLFDNKYMVPKGQWRLLFSVVPKIVNMWKLSGITFTIKYYSEVLRLVICFIDPHNKTFYDTGTWVARIKGKGPLSGLPTCLPDSVKQLCKVTRDGIYHGNLDRVTLIKFKLLVTLLAFFRATSPKWAEVKTSTITGPFTGESEVLSESEIRLALKDLGIGKLLVKKPNLFHFSMKAGPNAPLAVLGIGFDLIGWMCNPKKWYMYCLMCYTRGYYVCLTVFVVSSLVLVPLLPIVFWWDAIPLLGRIAVLEEARGKRRLIGITDWWTQVLFKPLHTSVYRQLDRLRSDGTRDQTAVVEYFISRLNLKGKCLVGLKGKRCQSMDLSAATDRLPVKLQAQILNILGYQGDLWMSLLDRHWLLDGKMVKYAVGQPMGAYSSFAMLALTHHVIVNIAARRAHCHPKNLIYMVLGDDGAMANSKVSKQYVKLFSILGMEINPIKGFDGTVLEFAKQLWTISGINVSPIGPKNIMLALRHVEFLPSVLYELFVKRFPMFIEYKRRVDRSTDYSVWWEKLGIHQVCMISAQSLFSLISRIHFQSGKKGKVIKFDLLTDEQKKDRIDITTKIKLRVLMAIGPVSGLWYMEPRIIKYLTGEGIYWLYRNMFIRGIYSWFYKSDKSFNFKTYQIFLIERIKRISQGRVSIRHNLFKAWVDMKAWLIMVFMLPLTHIVDFSRENERIPQIHNLLTPFTLIGLPSLILVHKGLKAFGNVISQSYKMFVFYFWRTLILINQGPLEILYIYIIGTLVLTWDIQFTIFFWVLPGTLYYGMISRKFGVWIKSHVYFSPTYGFPGVNVIEDKTSPTYDPFESSISTLVKVSAEKKLEDSGAWLNIISLLRNRKSVIQLLERQKENAKALIDAKVRRKTSGPRPNHKKLPNRAGASKK